MVELRPLGLVIALIWVSLFPSLPADAAKPVIAVLPFASSNRGNLGSMGRNVQPTFVTQFVNSGKVSVVDERALQRAMRKARYQKRRPASRSQTQELGKLLKADYLLSGKLTFVGDSFTMTTQLTNVKTAEVILADDVDFRNRRKFRLAIRSSAQRMLALITGEGRVEKTHEKFLNIDSRQFYDTADRCLRALKKLGIWRYEGEIDEELDGRKLHVQLRRGKPKPGMPLQVFEEGIGTNDKPIGVVYVIEPDEMGSGFVAKWIKEKDKSKRKRGDFGLGARVSNAGYKYRIAVGNLVDEAEDNETLVKMFKEKLLESLEESEQFIGKSSDQVEIILNDLGRGKKKKKNLKRLHKLGVDFVVQGKFIGDPGRRRAEFKIISAMTGSSWGKLKFETRI